MPALIMYPGIIYGPVQSRRLGLSLGINLLPVGRKVCSFNCVYCECGDTTELIDQARDEQGRRTTFPTVEAVRDEVETALRTYADLGALTFAGHGEPTLHPQFPEVVQAVREVRDLYQPQARVGVLSSAALVLRPRPRAGIDLCELRMMKLDAGDEATFQAIDRPAANVQLASIIEELARMPEIVLQTCLVDGPVQNIRGEPWDALLQAIGVIAPECVHLYPIDRPTPEPWVQKVPHAVVMARAAEIEERTGVPVEPYA
jgi:wyosine [tRNA(Phe)-imidazoG37] synthetase (radical SAM superfamily)